MWKIVIGKKLIFRDLTQFGAFSLLMEISQLFICVFLWRKSGEKQKQGPILT